MFVQSSHFIEHEGEDTAKKVVFYGQEKNPTTIRIAKMNLAVHGRFPVACPKETAKARRCRIFARRLNSISSQWTTTLPESGKRFGKSFCERAAYLSTEL